ncbi:MAG: hypothetical protein KDK71_10635, partial [Chlamydiia bacterium]|nr:hypothetical protein [Chlamydiia bacterium]
MARFHVLTLPVCAAGSLLQVSGTTFSHILSKTCNGTEKEYVVEKDKKVLKELSLKRDWRELVAHIVATVAIIFAYLPGIFFAGIFQCKPLADLPKSEEEQQIATLQESKNTGETTATEQKTQWETEKKILKKQALLGQMALHHPLISATYDQLQTFSLFFESLGISFHRYEGKDYLRLKEDGGVEYKYVQ